MVEKQFVIPEMYINKIPKCDDCVDTVLEDTGLRLMCKPAKILLQCPKCKKEYTFLEDDLKGEWVWRTI